MKVIDSKELTQTVLAAQKGDVKALALLIETTQDRLYKFCLYLCGQRPLAQDLCQDTYIKVLEHIHKLKKPEGFMPWLLTSAKNHYFDYLRSSAQKTLPLDPDFDLSDEARSSEQTEQLLELKKALGQLSAEDRLTLLLVDLEGYSYQEAAEIQGVSENAMRSRIFRARQQLLKKIDDERNETQGSTVSQVRSLV